MSDDPKMRDGSRTLLIIGNFLSGRGGVRCACEELSMRLRETGWKVRTASSRSSRLGRLGDMLWTTYRYRHDYSVAQVDVFSGPAFLWAEMVCWLLRRLNKPFVLTLRGGNLPTFSRRYPGRVRRLLGHADAVTAPSGYLQRELEHVCDRIQCIPNALDLTSTPTKCVERPSPKLIWLRAYHAIYNPLMAIECIRHLKEQHPSVHLTMVGPDKGYREVVETAIAEAGLETHVTLHGVVSKSEVPAYIARGDIFLNTPNIDNTPVTVLEAMAGGLCVVSTDVGGMSCLIESGHNGMLVAQGDAEAMADAVAGLLAGTIAAEPLSRAGQVTAKACDWQTVLPRWEQLLGSIGPSTSA